MGSSRSCGNLVTLACVCDPNLTSRDRNKEANTKACGSWHSALWCLCWMQESQLPSSEGAVSMVNSCRFTLQQHPEWHSALQRGISFWFLFIILSCDSVSDLIWLPEDVLPSQNAWVFTTSLSNLAGLGYLIWLKKTGKLDWVHCALCFHQKFFPFMFLLPQV